MNMNAVQPSPKHGSSRLKHRAADPSLPVLQLDDVCLSIPVHSHETRFLKSVLTRSVTGGALHRSRGGARIDALRNLTCSIYHGERIGLIGHNGAGKSTFLRLISGIYQPTSGHFRAHCTVSPMLQRSFITSQDLSGLQAVKGHYLISHGTMRGFDDYFNEIVEFSGLGDYIHLPLRGYSDGMRARLMFALATSSSHECLAIDEGFGAGDMNFFSRAKSRMESFIQSAGTLILATHSEALMRQFCTRGFVFNQGSIVFDGPIDEAYSFYIHGCL